MAWSMRCALVVVGLAVGSCNPAPIATPDLPSEGNADWELAPDWPQLPPGKVLGRVLGVALDSEGQVWISHLGEERNAPEILALDATTGQIIKAIDARDFVSPHALAFDAEGHLWITDDGANRIVVMDRAGQILRSIGSD
ncbi:MAG TPA: hypothetical protein VM580_02825 [Labilithrix sp.]|nr:hypothetical protein [Labilithrix sp.]